MLGTLAKPDGTYTDTGAETLENLLDCHFPDSVRDPADEPLNNQKANRLDWLRARRLIKPNQVSWALCTFEPKKAPGPDGIFPLLLQEGKEILTPVLTKLFQASVALGHVPKAWALAKAIFIPKPGKANYAEAKSFRPICLSSFLLKALEKILDKHVRDKIQRKAALHEFQYA